MMEALSGPPQRRQKATVRTVPPPVGGWNARDALDEMDPEDAVLMDNWFPRSNDVVMRKGSAPFTTSMGAGKSVKTLAELHAGAVDVFVAGCNGKLWEVSTGTPAQIATGFSEDAWQTTVFGHRMHLVNGVDTPQTYDGTTCADNVWTGPSDITKLINVVSFKSRLYFTEKDSQKFWYGDVNAVTGALAAFDLQYTGNFGGNILAMGVLTRDGGDGGNDLLVIMMSSGETIVYTGSDPGGTDPSTAFALIGVFYIGPPIGYRCFAKIGSDLVIITKDGYVPLTQVMPFGRALKNQQTTLSDKIRSAISDAVKAYGGNTGWQVLLYPVGNQLIFNVPRSATVFDQHIMNTETQAWARFRGMAARCWSLYQDKLYFGSTDGKVWLADNGTSDNGTAIDATAQPAWNYFSDRGHLKRFTQCRPIFNSIGNPSVFITLATDFKTPDGSDALISSVGGGLSVWNEATWDTATWGGGTQITDQWKSVSGYGYCASLRTRATSDSVQVSWQSTTYVWEKGGIM